MERQPEWRKRTAGKLLQRVVAAGKGLGYAAPEQYGGRQTDARTDIFGLGMLMHHLVTGEDPIMKSETRPIREIGPALSVGLERIILKCTEMDPDKRFQTAEELKDALHPTIIAPPNKKGFFGKLFGQAETSKRSEAVQEIYSKTKENMRRAIFYGEFDAAEKLLLALTDGSFGNTAPATFVGASRCTCRCGFAATEGLMQVSVWRTISKRPCIGAFRQLKPE